MSRNPALDTKVKALKAQMLTGKDFMNLIEFDNLKEVISYLREKTQYGPYLKNFSTDEVSRADIEGLLYQVVLDNAKKLLYFVLGSDRDIIKLIIQQINLESFLVLLRALNKKENFQNLIKHLSYSEDSKYFPIKKLLNVDNWDSFKDALKNTIYYRSLETYSTLDNQNLFELEKTFERSYYDLLSKKIKNLNNSSNKDLIKLLRSEIDMLNLIWIYRAKKFYNFGPDRILPFIYKGGLFIREDDLLRLASARDFDDFLELLRNYKQYNFLFDHEGVNLDLHMDRRMKRFLYFQFEQLLTFGHAISAAYSYLRMLLDEIDDLISIVEAKRYNLSKEETQEYLIRRLIL